MENIKLYYMERCPFCIKVRKFMEENGIEVEMVDINADPKNKENLVTLGGKVQVPCLDLNGTALYESGDIIQWFKDNK
ncbi:MAG: glutaredoxin [Tissierellia bacterium]|nr:glutaredoxin [Tissierellia bacterium]